MLYGLRGLIYSRYSSEAEFARVLNWPKQKLNRLTTGKTKVTVADANAIAEGLGMSVADLIPIFLHQESPNRQQKTGTN